VLVERGEAATELPSRIGAFGDHLKSFDVLIRSPGVPVDHPALVAARAAGVQVVNPASIWLAERGADLRVIGVTGSKGKSTTASLLAHLLRRRGESVLLAGNIGVPLLDHLDTDARTAVIELSSYQLSDLVGSLDLGVFTRLFPEHLDWHGSEQAYVASKLRLADCLDGRPLLVNGSDERLVQATDGIPGRVLANRPPSIWRRDDSLMLGERPLCESGDIPLIGRHNLDNAALALQAAVACGYRAEDLAGDLADFRALAHRLEPVGQVDGVRFINDSIATSPWATLAALQAIQPAGTVLIAGGMARPADWRPVVDWVCANGLAGLVSLPDNGADIERAIRDGARGCVARFDSVESLEEAVAVARDMAREGEVILLSPGAPSFNAFKDFEARGDRFRALVSAAGG
jgi:UDP-N-acetylmuramoylalanine--D-glutamate ligase